MNWKHAPVVPKTPLDVAQRAHHESIHSPSAKILDKEELLNLYSRMLLIRMFDQEVANRAQNGEGLAIHQYSGQEAVAVGVCSLLCQQDKIVSNHRPFGHFIAKGGTIKELMAELYGKKTGVTKGLGGEMNLSEPSIGFLMSTMFVGANITISTGVALSQKLMNENGITVCFFGEGASTNGAFHEALTMASLFKLPILYVCENNGYSTNTPAIEYMPTELVEHRANGYGFPTTVVDGSDVISVVQSAGKAIDHIKAKKEPYFIEAIVGRLGPHKQELVDTRTKEEKLTARFQDPITRLKNLMLSENMLSDGEDLLLKNSIRQDIFEAIEFAQRSQKLTFDEMIKFVYAGQS